MKNPVRDNRRRVQLTEAVREKFEKTYQPDLEVYHHLVDDS